MNREEGVRFGTAVSEPYPEMLPELFLEFVRVPPHVELLVHTEQPTEAVLAELQPLFAEAERRDLALGGRGFSLDVTRTRTRAIRVRLIPDRPDGAVERLQSVFADSRGIWDGTVTTPHRHDFRLHLK